MATTIKIGSEVRAEIAATVQGFRDHVAQGESLRVRLLKILLAAKTRKASWEEVVKEVREALWREYCSQTGISEDTKPRHIQPGWGAINSSISEVRKIAERKDIANAVVNGEVTVSSALRAIKKEGAKPKQQQSKLVEEVQARPIAAAQNLATLPGVLDDGTPIAIEAVMEALRSVPEALLPQLLPMVTSWAAEVQSKLAEAGVEVSI